MRFDHWSFYWIVVLVVLYLLALPRPARFASLLPLAYLWTAEIRLGLSWSGFKLLAVFYVLSLLTSGTRFSRSSLPYAQILLILTLYVLAVSGYGLANMPPDIPFLHLVLSDVQRPPYRQLLQIALWLAGLLALFVSFWAIRSSNDFSRVLRVTFWSAAIVACVSFLMLVSSLAAPSVARALGMFLSYPQSIDSSGLRLRLAPFSFEPRYYGRAMAIVACLTMLCRVFPISGIPKWVTKAGTAEIALLLSLLSASVTTAGSAILGFLAVTLWLLALSGERRRTGDRFRASRVATSSPPQKRTAERGVAADSHAVLVTAKSRTILGAVVIGISVFTLFWAARLSGERSLIEERSLEYLAVSGIDVEGSNLFVNLSDNVDTSWNAYVRWLATEPFYLIFGAGLGNPAFRAYWYLPEGGIVARMGLLSTRLPLLEAIGGYGLIGIALLLVLFALWFSHLGRAAYNMTTEDYNTIQICRGMILFLLPAMVFHDTLPLAWFFAGTGLGVCSAYVRNPVVSRSAVSRLPGTFPSIPYGR